MVWILKWFFRDMILTTRIVSIVFFFFFYGVAKDKSGEHITICCVWAGQCVI